MYKNTPKQIIYFVWRINYIELCMKYINYIQENIHDGMKTMRTDIPKKYILCLKNKLLNDNVGPMTKSTFAVHTKVFILEFIFS